VAAAVTPAEFPALFAEGWALPKPEAFLDYFLPKIDADATFRQPMFPDAHGPAQIERMFRQLFGLFPDLAGTVRRSAVAGDIVFIESGFTAALGRKIVRFDVCDRFTIRNGKVADRRSFSDPSPFCSPSLAAQQAGRVPSGHGSDDGRLACSGASRSGAAHVRPAQCHATS
jgi:limonene-1,2-epoxide hydrolase